MTSPFDTVHLGEFTQPFDDVDGLAAYILNPENIGMAFVELRKRIIWIAVRTPVGSTPNWHSSGDLLRILPVSRTLMSGLIEEEQRIVAWHVLDRAVEIVRARR